MYSFVNSRECAIRSVNYRYWQLKLLFTNLAMRKNIRVLAVIISCAALMIIINLFALCSLPAVPDHLGSEGILTDFTYRYDMQS